MDSSLGWEIQARWRTAGIYGLLGHGVQGPLATPSPVVNHSEPPTVRRPQMHQEAARRENSIQRHGTIARAPDPSVALRGGLLVFPCCADACRGMVVSGV